RQGERARERRHLPVVDLQVLGAHPDRFHGRRDRERLAVAVAHRSTGGRHLDDAPVARLALRLEEIGVDGLQVERSGGERGEAGDREDEEEARAPPLELQAKLRGAPLEALVELALELHFGGLPGVTTTVVLASGKRMPSEREASDSIRLFVAHVLCSSV